MLIGLIHLFFTVIEKFSSEYLMLKLLKQECIRIDTDECLSIQQKFQLTHSFNLENNLEFQSSKDIQCLKSVQSINTNIQINSGIQLYDDLNRIAIIPMKKFEDIFPIVDHIKTYVIYIRIKIIDKNPFNINFISISILTKRTVNDGKNPTPETIENFKKLYSFNFETDYNKYTFASRSIFWCEYIDGNTCKQKFLSEFSFKNGDNGNLQSEDPIFNNYLLNGIILKNEFEMVVNYKFQQNYPPETTDFQDIDYSKFKIQNTGSISSCQHIRENDFYNIECTCPWQFKGLICEHKIYCSNCTNKKCEKDNCSQCKFGWKEANCLKIDCEKLGFCGLNGKCNITTSMCDCQSGWAGKYCTRSLKINIGSSTYEPPYKIITTSSLKINNDSKIKMILGIIFAIVIVVVIIIALKLYLSKSCI